jgi:hypothetical protein
MFGRAGRTVIGIASSLTLRDGVFVMLLLGFGFGFSVLGVLLAPAAQR